MWSCPWRPAAAPHKPADDLCSRLGWPSVATPKGEDCKVLEWMARVVETMWDRRHAAGRDARRRRAEGEATNSERERARLAALDEGLCRAMPRTQEDNESEDDAAPARDDNEDCISDAGVDWLVGAADAPKNEDSAADA